MFGLSILFILLMAMWPGGKFRRSYLPSLEVAVLIAPPASSGGISSSSPGAGFGASGFGGKMASSSSGYGGLGGTTSALDGAGNGVLGYLG